MWICSRLGFFSIIRNGGPETWRICARCEGDLVELIRTSGVKAAIVATPKSDYSFELIVDAKGLTNVFAVLGKSIDYVNFQNEVAALPHQRDKVPAYDEFSVAMRRVQANGSQSRGAEASEADTAAQELIIRRHGGYLSRVLETLNGFKDKY